MVISKISVKENLQKTYPRVMVAKRTKNSNSVMLLRVQFSKGMESTKKWEISKSNVSLMKKVQNMTKVKNGQPSFRVVWRPMFPKNLKMLVTKMLREGSLSAVVAARMG
jgi:hypothetical protein